MTKVFLDTTYLLPLIGIETSLEQFNIQFEKSIEDRSISYLYSSVSIIELKWIIKKISKSIKTRQKLEDQLNDLLRLLTASAKFDQVDFSNDIINQISFKMETLGHSDYFDTIIASSAITSSDVFLTEDKALSKIIPKTLDLLEPYFNYKINVKNWHKFVSMKN